MHHCQQLQMTHTYEKANAPHLLLLQASIIASLLLLLYCAIGSSSCSSSCSRRIALILAAFITDRKGVLLQGRSGNPAHGHNI
jgi:hypothetical protein